VERDSRAREDFEHGETTHAYLAVRRRDDHQRGLVLIFLGIFGGGHVDVLALGAALLFGAGLFQTIDNRRATR
jgi:hypothetical protein